MVSPIKPNTKFSQYWSNTSGVYDLIATNSQPFLFAGSSHAGWIPFLNKPNALIILPSTKIFVLPSPKISLNC